MSKHKVPLTPLEESGLRAHGLGRCIGKPSQLADVFRQGIAWAIEKSAPVPVLGEAVAWQMQAIGQRVGEWFDCSKESYEIWRASGDYKFEGRELYAAPTTHITQAELDGLRSRVAELEARLAQYEGAEVAAWQFKEGGKWFSVMNEKHRKDTAEAGYTMRALIARPTNPENNNE